MVKRTIDYNAALAKAAAVCSRAEHAEAEVMRKLKQWGAEPEVAARVVEWLVDNGFIDNERYARAFVYDKSRFDMWGRVKIRHHLRQNGIDSAVINEAMDEIDKAEYAANLDALMKAKRRSMPSDADPYKAKAALLRYGASRGYEPAMVLAAISRLVDGADDFNCDGDGLETAD